MSKFVKKNITIKMKKILIITFTTFFIIIGLYVIFIDIFEITQQIKGRYSFFNNVTILSNKQIIYYCLGWILLMLIDMILIIYNTLKKKWDFVFYLSISIFIIVILHLFIDSKLTIQLG